MQRLVQLLGWALTVVVMGCSQTDDLPLGDDALPEAVCGRDACDCDQACLAADACDALADRSVGDCILACVDGGLDVSFSCDLNDACDASCVQLRERSVGRVELYGTWPAVQRPSGGWRRQCDPGPTDGLIIDLLLMSSAADGSEAPAREGDWLQGQRALTGDGRLLAPHTLLSDLEIDTLSDEPRIDLLVAGPADHFDYQQQTSERAEAATLILVDASSGMDSLAAIGTAADLVIQFQTLSGEGAVIYFNEGELRACDTVSDTLLETLETCFSPTAEPQIHPAPSFEGRSNLWTALAETHGALASLSSRFERVDLVVVTGGPDDCPPPDAGDCGLPCANTVDVEHVRELVAQGQQPGGTPLRVSFLHIDVSRQGPDPEQLDIACRSGGHYLFAPELSVNSDPDGVTRIFRELLHTGPGYWRAVVETLRLRQMDEQLGQVTGKFVLKPEAELSRFRQERLFRKQTGIGQQELFLRPACSPEVGCPDLGLSCSPKSLTCDAETPDPCR